MTPVAIGRKLFAEGARRVFQSTADISSALAVAEAFVVARRSAAPLRVYPGCAPRNLEEAYRIQDLAISLWSDEIAGWKVGRIHAPDSGLLGVDRLIGPIFARSVVEAAAVSGATTVHEMPVFADGFAAVEGEYLVRIRTDAPAGKAVWSAKEAEDMIASVHVGLEIASSPYEGINADGPLVTISDFGNNSGLIVGPALENWRGFDVATWDVETEIDGVLEGSGVAADLPGGPLASLQAALAIAAQLGRPLRAGMWISTGAVSGVHEAKPGMTARVAFHNGAYRLACRLRGA
ncbi:MAG: 2-keto-4-pentenoate hydratase [Caulobacterales bacterium]